MFLFAEVKRLSVRKQQITSVRRPKASEVEYICCRSLVSCIRSNGTKHPQITLAITVRGYCWASTSKHENRQGHYSYMGCVSVNLTWYLHTYPVGATKQETH